jgi:uncharacterized protein YndB with AHSA1/START domain
MSCRGDAIEREIFIAAPPETVFGFLVDPELMSRWIGSCHRLDPRPGGTFQVQVSPGNVARGAFTEVVPFRRVGFTWGWETNDPALGQLRPGESLVEIELESKGDGTLVRLRHSRLPSALLETHGERWSIYLDRLSATLRSGDQALNSERQL